jgi:hypothetical protein
MEGWKDGGMEAATRYDLQSFNPSILPSARQSVLLPAPNFSNDGLQLTKNENHPTL